MNVANHFQKVIRSGLKPRPSHTSAWIFTSCNAICRALPSWTRDIGRLRVLELDMLVVISVPICLIYVSHMCYICLIYIYMCMIYVSYMSQMLRSAALCLRSKDVQGTGELVDSLENSKRRDSCRNSLSVDPESLDTAQHAQQIPRSLL